MIAPLIALGLALAIAFFGSAEGSFVDDAKRVSIGPCLVLESYPIESDPMLPQRDRLRRSKGSRST